MVQNTRIEYLYRDASNYKFYGSFVVGGTVELSDLEPFMFDREWFVPHEVGLPHLLDLAMNDDDHWLHELTDIAPTNDGAPICTAAELIQRFRAADRAGWFSQTVRHERRSPRTGLE